MSMSKVSNVVYVSWQMYVEEYVCTYVYISLLIYAHIHMHDTYLHTHIHTHTYLERETKMCIYMYYMYNTYAFMRACTPASTDVRMYVRMCMRVCTLSDVNVCVCEHVFV